MLEVECSENAQELTSPVAGDLSSEPGWCEASAVTASKPNKGFPGGAVDKNLPANTGDMSSIPDRGSFHMLRGRGWGQGWQLSSCATTTELREATTMRSLRTTTRE